MRSTTTSKSSARRALASPHALHGARPADWVRRAGFALALLGVGVAGCAYVPNYFKEDGPATTMSWDSPSAADVKARYQPTPVVARTGEPQTLAPKDGVVRHFPVYFENPFVDKGHGRTDETDPLDVYRGGWEDFVAAPYDFARFHVNWVGLPVSFIVTPPVTVQESDGELSRQLLGYDHDAESVGYIWDDPSELRPILAQREKSNDARADKPAGPAPETAAPSSPPSPSTPARVGELTPVQPQ
ncbi:MAG: hypothetical protein IPM13_04010 [Phycisphaerales bacterium]|nr:hypothetical protein [Phycisphaerales bacterium]